MFKVKVIGCGGIATGLLPVLCKYLDRTVRTGCEVTLIDGDTFERRNEERQSFDVPEPYEDLADKDENGKPRLKIRYKPLLGPKADVTAEMYRLRHPNIWFESRPVYITDDNSLMLIREGDVVFSCVDNHATRKVISDRCVELENVTLISGGNDFTDGNIQVYHKLDGKEYSLPVANKYHPEITSPHDKNPGDEPPVEEERQGCGVVVETHPQLIFTNNSIAAKMLECYYVVMMGKLKYDEVYVDLMTGACRPVKRNPE